MLSNLKINFLKSEVIATSVSTIEQTRVVALLNCQTGSFPITYLGFPIMNKNLTMLNWEGLISLMADRVEPWRGRFMSSAAHLTLINSSLASIPTFVMAMFLLADGTHDAFDKHLPHFSCKEWRISGTTTWLTDQTCVDPRRGWPWGTKLETF
jgi:hypothetical protein